MIAIRQYYTNHTFCFLKNAEYIMGYTVVPLGDKLLLLPAVGSNLALSRDL